MSSPLLSRTSQTSTTWSTLLCSPPEALVSTLKEARGKAYFISNAEPCGAGTIASDMLGCADRKLLPALGLARTLGAVIEWSHRTLGLRGEPRLTRMKVDVLTLHCWLDIGAPKRDLGYCPRVTTAQCLEHLRTSSILGDFGDALRPPSVATPT